MDNFDKFKKSLPSKGFTNAKNIVDFDDCDRPACDDTISALSKALKHSQQTSSTANNPPSAATTTTRTTTTRQCPPTKAALGTSSWDLLHSMTAWYPDKPTVDDQTLMKQFFTSFARFYPCTWCADDFQANLKKRPVQTDSRESLCMWLCEQHNIVNEKLGKPTFQCNMKNLDERWRKSSDPKCN